MESPENHDKLVKTGLNNWSICKSPKGTKLDVRKGKFSLLACHPLQMLKGNLWWFGDGQVRHQNHK